MAASDGLPPSLLPALADFAMAQLGLRCTDKNWGDIAEAVREIAGELKFESVAICARWLLTNPPNPRPLEILARHLTVGESYFFRETASFDSLRQRILPELLKARRARRRLRIWSAGCATGEEPYSIAMLLEQLVPDLGRWDIELLGTDINTDSLAVAQRGVYRDWSFRGVSDQVRERFFRPCGDGLWEIASHIRERVRFAPLNLIAGAYPAPFDRPATFDLILCRNVLMYFEPSHAQRTARRLTRLLQGDGWLMLGAAEGPHLAFDVMAATGRKIVEAPPRPIFSIVAATPAPPVAPSPPVAAPTDDPYQRALDLYRQRRYEAAIEVAHAYLATVPDSAKALALLARINANSGALDAALDWSHRAITADKIDPALHYLHAVILNEIGRQTDAAASLQRALYLAPDFVLAHYLLGVLAQTDANPRAARRHLGNALSLLARRPPDETVDDDASLSIAALTDIVQAMMARPAETAPLRDSGT